MSNKYNSPSFNRLKSYWYNLLDRSGFYDIERYDQDKQVFADYEAKSRYYQLAGLYLHDATFETSDERSVWELHSKGLANSKVASIMMMPKRIVNEMITKHKKVMLPRNG
jgi:hypothetical protein